MVLSTLEDSTCPGSGFDEVETLLREGPREEHHFVGCVDLNEMMDDFDIDGSTYQVQILD